VLRLSLLRRAHDRKALRSRCKIHDLLIESVELALKKRGYPALADMKAKWQRKER
jgi:hypothetical protein